MNIHTQGWPFVGRRSRPPFRARLSIFHIRRRFYRYRDSVLWVTLER